MQKILMPQFAKIIYELDFESRSQRDKAELHMCSYHYKSIAIMLQDSSKSNQNTLFIKPGTSCTFVSLARLLSI